ncbi:cytochrome P450 3A5-like isoform X2 [Dermacentor andersoni]|uniref:cytochrome P450 3A5-like isoform X2 n=1 Tax=Dermacentor andersoni TaxID=34620 RepID=UPI002416FDC9|nr:cytochrome P450 3A5-like isoform X2 [Dermacentor andersoni]
MTEREPTTMNWAPMWFYVKISVWTTIVAVLVYGLLRLFRWRQKTFSYFKEIGIDGPKPNLLWGNLAEYHGKGLVKALTEWCDKYGDVFGFYNGDVPTLVIKDIDFLTHIFVKNFQDFTSRGVTMRTDEEHSFLGQSLLHARGLQWKRTRSCVSYAFTANKFKQMVPYMSQVADIFVQILGEKADDGKEYPMLRLFQGLTMDYVGRAAFGFDCTFQRELTHPFLKTAQSVLPGVMTGPVHMLAHSTTTMSKYIAPILWLNEKIGSFTYDIFNKHTSKVVQLRMKNPEARKPDMLQTMLDVESEEGELPEAPQLLDADAKLFKRMSPEEVGINTTILFIAGFETTATGLSYLAYVLAKHQDVQENVREEVKSVIARYGELDYTAITQGLKYLARVVDETLRMFPPVVTFTTRSAVNDFEYNGIKYKAGTSILSPTIQIHMDPRIWPEPEKFDPDRFLPENVAARPTIAYQPFGDGPRNCIGKRLALLEIIYTGARMVEKFKLTLGESQKGRMNMDYHAMVSSPGDGPYIVFHRL